MKTRYVRGDLNKAAAMIDKIHEGIYTDFIWMYSNPVRQCYLVFPSALLRQEIFFECKTEADLCVEGAG